MTSRIPGLVSAALVVALVAPSACKPPVENKEEKAAQMKTYVKDSVFKEMLKKAEGGAHDFQFVVGNMYYLGEEVKQDYAQAVEWFLKSASQGNWEAQYALGRMYGRGEGVNRDWGKAAMWLKRAASRGHIRAQCMLGTMYRNGEGVPRDLELAKEFFVKAADAGDPNANHALGEMYERGEGVLKSRSAAAERYYTAGTILLKLGYRDDALANLDALHRASPQSPYLKKLNDAIYASGSAEKAREFPR